MTNEFYFFVEYEYNNFMHMSKDEFMPLQCTPIACSHMYPKNVTCDIIWIF